MPIRGRRGFSQSNVVRNLPSLPVPIILGKLSVNNNFGNHPTGSIEYEAIHKKDISIYEGAYNPKNNRRINIYGTPFRVREDGGYSYSREEYIYKEDTSIEAFKVKIELDGWWKKPCERKIRVKNLVQNTNKKTIYASQIASAVGVPYSGSSFAIPVDNIDQSISLSDVLNEHALILGGYVNYNGSSVRIVPLDSANRWGFDFTQIIEDGSNTLGLAPYYNESELTFEENREETKFYLIDPKPRFKQKEPVIKVETEEDEDIQSPPKNTQVLRDLTSNHDNSGPKKVRKTTTTVDGHPISEVTEIWGFAYYWEDQDNPEGDFIISNPDRFWVQVEEETRTYIYEQVSSPAVAISTKDPTGQQAKLVVHPDYLEHITISLGLESAITTTPNVEYLTGITTSGWTLTRPSPEPAEDGSTTLDGPPPDGSAFYPLMKFRKLEKADAIKYYMVPTRDDFGEQGAGKPFEIEWTDWLSLDPTLRARIGNNSGTIQDGEIGATNNRIGLIKPDLNYVEPLSIWVESRQGSSFAAFAHPENDPKNGNPKQPIICGEESYYKDSWTKLDEDYCRQKIVNFTAQDYGFSSLKEEVKYRRILGKPPEAQYKQRTWEEVTDTLNNPTISSTQAFKTRYFLYSDQIPSGASVTGDLSFPLAKNLGEAVKAAKTQLRLDSIQGSTAKNATISWFYPQIKEGDVINFAKDRFSRYGKWRVLSSSWTLDYNGVNQNKFGVEATCSGTQVTCGMDESRTVRVVTRKEPIAANPEGQNQGKDPEVKSQTRRSISSLGSILESAPGRRMN